MHFLTSSPFFFLPKMWVVMLRHLSQYFGLVKKQNKSSIIRPLTIIVSLLGQSFLRPVILPRNSVTFFTLPKFLMDVPPFFCLNKLMVSLMKTITTIPIHLVFLLGPKVVRLFLDYLNEIVDVFLRPR